MSGGPSQVDDTDHPWAHPERLELGEVSRHLADLTATIRRVERWLATAGGDPALREQNASWLAELKMEHAMFAREYERRTRG